MSAKTNGNMRRSSFGQRSGSSIAIEIVIGLVIIFVVNLLLYGIGGAVTEWACFAIGGVLMVHAVGSVFAKVIRQLGKGPAIMTIICLAAVLLAVPAVAEARTQQSCDAYGCYTIYPAVPPAGVTSLTSNGLPPVGCRTVLGWSTGTYPTLVISLHPLSFHFKVDYTWPVPLTYCWEGGWRAQGNLAIVQWQKLVSVHINKSVPWQNVDTGVVKGYRYTSTTPVWNTDHSCVTVRVHAEVELGIPSIPHILLPPDLVTKPWIEFDNLCKDGSFGEVRHDKEPA